VTVRLEIFDQEPITGRTPYLLIVGDPQEIAGALDIPEAGFVCLLAWDAAGVSDDVILGVAGSLLDAGAKCICTWGSDCERVHDLVDQAAFGSAADYDVDPVIMTSWHEGEPLEETIDFFLTDADPDEAYDEECTGAVAVTIGNAEYAEKICGVLRFLVS
jgi:hypothetical protein